jgi:hypothetical protein
MSASPTRDTPAFTVELVDPEDPVPEGPNWATVSLGLRLSNVVGFVGPQAPEQS